MRDQGDTTPAPAAKGAKRTGKERVKTSNFLGVDFGREGGRLGLDLFSLRFLQLLLESLNAGEQVVGGGLFALSDEPLVIKLLLQSLHRCL